MGFPGGADGEEAACNAGDQVQSLGWEDPLERGMATHSSILAWRIPQTKKPGGLLVLELRRVRLTCVTKHTHIDYQNGTSRRACFK